MTNEDEIIVPSHSQLFGPRAEEICESDGSGLNHMVWMSFWSSVKGCSFSLVTYASICNCIFVRICVGVPEIGSKRSSIVRSAEFLKAQMRRNRGIVCKFAFWLWKMISRIKEMKGVIPLPPLTITRDSCLAPSRSQTPIGLIKREINHAIQIHI
jgi:hypothetical protein